MHGLADDGVGIRAIDDYSVTQHGRSDLGDVVDDHVIAS